MQKEENLLSSADDGSIDVEKCCVGIRSCVVGMLLG